MDIEYSYLTSGLSLLMVLGIIVWIFFWINVWRKYNKQLQDSTVPEYLQFPPSKLPPAIVESLLTVGGAVTPKSFSATILDLSLRKIITIEIKEERIKGNGLKYQYTLHLTDQNYSKNAHLRFYEKLLLDFIFTEIADKSSIKAEELKNAMIENGAPRAQNFYSRWSSQIKKEGKENFLKDPEGVLLQKRFLKSAVIFIAILAIGNLVSYLVGTNLDAGVFYLLFFFAFVAFSSSKLFLLTDKRVGLEIKKWRAFKKYLEDYGHFKDKESHAVIVWEEILIYAIVLGVAPAATNNLSSFVVMYNYPSPNETL